MLIKKSWLLMGIVAVTLGSALTFSGCIQQEKAIGDDYLLFRQWPEGLRPEGLNYLLHITKGGYAEFTTYVISSHKINTYRSGELSEGDMKELSEFIENSGFFQLVSDYIPEIEAQGWEEAWEELVEPYRVDQIISVYKEDEIKSVYVLEAANFDVTPTEFKEVKNYLMEEVVPRLKDDRRCGTFMKAEKYYENGTRVEFIVFSEEGLAAHPFLAQAILNPEWFIYIGSLDNTELEEYIIQDEQLNKYFFVTYEGTDFEVEVYERLK